MVFGIHLLFMQVTLGPAYPIYQLKKKIKQIINFYVSNGKLGTEVGMTTINGNLSRS